MPISPAILAILGRAPLLSGLTPADRQAIAGLLRTQRLAPGAVFLRQGTPDGRLGIVAQGELVVVDEAAHGSVELARVGVGEAIGEMSLVDAAPVSVTVKAVSNTVVLVLDRVGFDGIRRNAPHVMAAIIDGVARSVAARSRALARRIEEEAPPAPPSPPEMVEPPGVDRYTGSVSVQGVAFFDGFTPEEVARILRGCPVYRVRPGTLLCREGLEGDRCYVILGGQVDLIKAVRDGQRLVATMDTGSVVGQYALVDAGARWTSIVARDDSLCMVITRDVLSRALMSQDPLALKLLERIVVAGIRQLRGIIDHLRALESTFRPVQSKQPLSPLDAMRARRPKTAPADMPFRARPTARLGAPIRPQRPLPSTLRSEGPAAPRDRAGRRPLAAAAPKPSAAPKPRQVSGRRRLQTGALERAQEELDALREGRKGLRPAALWADAGVTRPVSEDVGTVLPSANELAAAVAESRTKAAAAARAVEVAEAAHEAAHEAVHKAATADPLGAADFSSGLPEQKVAAAPVQVPVPAPEVASLALELEEMELAESWAGPESDVLGGLDDLMRDGLNFEDPDTGRSLDQAMEEWAGDGPKPDKVRPVTNPFRRIPSKL